MTAFILTVVLSLAGAEQKPEAKLDEKVATAREKAIEFLKKQQNAAGNWEESLLRIVADMDGGITALATLGLLEAGVPAKDPVVTKAVEYLVKLEPKKTYVVSLQTQVLSRLDGEKHKDRFKRTWTGLSRKL